MQALLFSDLTKKQLSETLGGPSFQWPILTYGEDVTIRLRLAERINGIAVETSRVVNQVRVGVGNIDTPPEAGQFRLHIGDDAPSPGVNVTADLSTKSTPEQVQAAINVLSGISGIGVASVTARSGSWCVTFASQSQAVEIKLASNTLTPTAFLQVRTREVNGLMEHELRLIQAPAAFTSQSAIVVPPLPSIATLADGGESGEGGAKWPEVQKLTLPPDYRGAFVLRRGAVETVLLSREDSASSIQRALAPLADDGGEFQVTNPQDDVMHITFAGTMDGINHEPLEVVSKDAPEGDIQFTLSLSSPELLAMLRRSSQVELPIEIEADIEDVNDDEIGYTLKLFRGTVKITRELNWKELATVPNTDWTRPPLPKDYGPYSPSQVSNGQLHSSGEIGNGVDTVIVYDHGLNTHKIAVFIYPNDEDGAPLSRGMDYTFERVGPNSIEITFAEAPSVDEYVVTVLGLEQTSFFDSHSHPIGQITNLQTVLDDYASRIVALEALGGTGAVATEVRVSGIPAAQWELPSVWEAYPSRQAIPAPANHIASLDEQSMPRERGLLAAVHDAAAQALPIPPPKPSSGFFGNVYQNQSGASVLLPGGMGHRSVTLKPGDYAACDGRTWYPLAHAAGTTSYYPAAFERTLFELHVNDKQLRLKKRLELLFALELAVLKSNTKAFWTVVIEHGEAQKETSPATTGPNLSQIAWDTANPILEQRIVVTPISATHRFGAIVDRRMIGGVDTVLAYRHLYGAVEGAAAPPTANFAVRLRLKWFDTEDSQTDPKGFAVIKGLKIDGGPSNEGLAIIA